MSDDALPRLLKSLQKLPGIGPRSAERIAWHLLRRSKEDAMELARAIRDLKLNVRHCSHCGNLAESDPCPLCTSAKRDRSIICVVEAPRDVAVLEKTNAYNGLYHVLGGRLAPLDGVGVEDLHIDQLLARVRGESEPDRVDPTSPFSSEQEEVVPTPSNEPVCEVILALSATLEGEQTARLVAEALAESGVKVTKIAQGVPSGAELEYVGKGTLEQALRMRR